MPQRSAGLLIYRHERAQRGAKDGDHGEGSDGGRVSVLLIHPGGPLWRHRDAGAWQIPKGRIEGDETPEIAAMREGHEELGVALAGVLQPLGEVRQSGGKFVTAFALEQQVDVAAISSNLFEMEWPPRSGQTRAYPEVDEARWFALAQAGAFMLPSQRPFLDRLENLLRDR
jgi:predicted NUDIX family NTP pyrophosphohydrolase